MRRFDISKDLAELNGWYRARGLPEVPLEALPLTGLIVPGVAAGFLYLTDSSLAMLEGFCTNPQVGRDERARALDQIIAALFVEADRMRCTKVIGLVQSPLIEQLGIKNGARSGGRYVLQVKDV